MEEAPPLSLSLSPIFTHPSFLNSSICTLHSFTRSFHLLSMSFSRSFTFLHSCSTSFPFSFSLPFPPPPESLSFWLAYLSLSMFLCCNMAWPVVTPYYSNRLKSRFPIQRFFAKQQQKLENSSRPPPCLVGHWGSPWRPFVVLGGSVPVCALIGACFVCFIDRVCLWAVC